MKHHGYTLTREICKKCGKENAIGFSVSDKCWHSVVPTEYSDKVLCIDCFDQFAADKHIAWEEFLSPDDFNGLYPVSAETIRRINNE